MHLSVYSIISLLLSFGESHASQHWNNRRLFALITKTSEADATYQSIGTPQADATSSSRQSVLPAVTAVSVSANTSSTTTNTCQGQNESCTSSEPAAVRSGHLSFKDQSLYEQCMLWDDSCSGNITKAENMFFGKTMEEARSCLYLLNTNETRNNHYCNLLGSNENITKLRKWMRTPQCLSKLVSYQHAHPNYFRDSIDNWPTCCGTCHAIGTTVDIFYWPDPDADYSCLSIIENSASPFDMGATSSSTWSVGTMLFSTFVPPYWGCTARTPKEGTSFITTARVLTKGATTFKVAYANPWDPPDCLGVSKQNAIPHSNHTAIRLETVYNSEDYFERTPPSPMQVNNGPVVTAVMDGYTL